MMRRLFFVLPNNRQASQFAVDLEHDAAIHQEHIHAMARDNDPITGVNSVQNMNDTDQDARIEWWGWRINLALFMCALVVFVVMLIGSSGFWLMAPALIIVVTFVAGLVFALRLPIVHLNEFFSSVCHGEILMMVDVRASQVYDVSRYIRRRHPEAITGGVGVHF